jgi:membrane-associated phospholipid phosphatase
MSDPIVLREDEPPVVPSSLSKRLHIRIARYISAILSPIAVSLPSVLLVALYHERNQFTAALNTCLTLFFLSVGPMIYILIGVRLGKFSDVDVSDRTQRSGPFIFGIISALVGFLFLSLIHGPKNLQTVLLLTVIVGIIMMIITLWWKISVHASSLAGAATVLTALYGAVMLPSFALVVLVGWSRVVLRRHTLAQVIAGSCLNIALTTIVLMIRGI